LVWLKFIACLVIILFAGAKLARYGDAIAEKSGLGRIWIGLAFLAFITSMPEMVTGVSSVAIVELPDLGVGTLLGSCMFNLFILALLDILHRSTPILSRASSRNIGLAGLGILLTAVAAVGILVGGKLPWLTLGWIGVPVIIVLVLYLLGVWRIYHFERNHLLEQPEAIPSQQYAAIPLRMVCLRFALAAIAVIGAGIWLSIVGDEIATITGWGTSFVGSLFLAIGTSLPELVVAIAALRIGAIDMAIADILGANMLDITLFFLVDLFYREGPVLLAISNAHLITAAVAAAMSLVVILGLRFRQERKTFFVISWYGPILIGLYIFGAYALFISGAG